MPANSDLPVHRFERPEDWERWLDERQATSAGLWLEIATRGSGVASVSYEDALQVALRFGWIDGQKARSGDGYWRQRFTPRRPGSRWSLANREKVEALEAGGLMRPAGALEVERARADGRWDAAYAGERTIAVPDDLALALAADEQARDFFAALDSRNRYAILYRVQDAARPATRARRIEKFVTMLGRHEKPYP